MRGRLFSDRAWSAATAIGLCCVALPAFGQEGDGGVPAWMAHLNRLPPEQRVHLVGDAERSVQPLTRPVVAVIRHAEADRSPSPEHGRESAARTASVSLSEPQSRMATGLASAAATNVGRGGDDLLTPAERDRPETGPIEPRAPERDAGWREAGAPGASAGVSTLLFDGFATAGGPGRQAGGAAGDGAAGGARVDALLAECGRLSTMGLRYEFGSEDPASGGLDCSGTVQHVLERIGFDSVPRQANTQYLWLEKNGTLNRIRPWTSSRSVLRKLRPGDLLFWKGTYAVRRKPDVTHVMIYLGEEEGSGRRLMFGASSRTGRGLNGNAVDVYTFDWPNESGKGEFIAYGSIPGLQD